jgi:hypothetical protein
LGLRPKPEYVKQLRFLMLMLDDGLGSGHCAVRLLLT